MESRMVSTEGGSKQPIKGHKAPLGAGSAHHQRLSLGGQNTSHLCSNCHITQDKAARASLTHERPVAPLRFEIVLSNML